jgi:adenine deaminase
MATIEEVRAEAERVISLAKDDQYVGGQQLAGMVLNQVEVTVDELAEQIAVGVHTGLRKGSDADDAHNLWKVISDSETNAWISAATFCASGLQSMGYRITRDAD